MREKIVPEDDVPIVLEEGVMDLLSAAPVLLDDAQFDTSLPPKRRGTPGPSRIPTKQGPPPNNTPALKRRRTALESKGKPAPASRTPAVVGKEPAEEASPTATLGQAPAVHWYPTGPRTLPRPAPSLERQLLNQRLPGAFLGVRQTGPC